MSESTDLVPAVADPGEGYGYCSWHKGYAATVVVVDAIERPSGPPFPLSACRSCREQRGLTALGHGGS